MKQIDNKIEELVEKRKIILDQLESLNKTNDFLMIQDLKEQKLELNKEIIHLCGIKEKDKIMRNYKYSYSYQTF